jgi:3'-5' exoribonuclease
MTKKHPINSLKRDQIIDDFYAVMNKRSPVQYARGWRFELMLTDPTGTIMLKFWGGTNEEMIRQFYESITEGGVIRVQCRVNEFNGRLELSVTENDTISVLKDGEYDPVDFVAVSQKNINAMWNDYKTMMDSVKNPTLSIILKETFKDPAFVERFKKAPGAMIKHHAWIGGLMEHELSVAKLCDAARAAEYSSLDRDLMITGALLHDLGKLEEYETKATIKTTVPGLLVGHLVIGTAQILSFKGKPGVDENTLLKLAHILVSHHAEIAWGSPKVPAFPEALVISAMDALDGKMVRMQKLMADADPEAIELYDPKEERNIYLR